MQAVVPDFSGQGEPRKNEWEKKPKIHQPKFTKMQAHFLPPPDETKKISD
jgi:hypothetical protein